MKFTRERGLHIKKWYRQVILISKDIQISCNLQKTLDSHFSYVHSKGLHIDGEWRTEVVSQIMDDLMGSPEALRCDSVGKMGTYCQSRQTAVYCSFRNILIRKDNDLTCS